MKALKNKIDTEKSDYTPKMAFHHAMGRSKHRVKFLFKVLKC